MVVRIKASSHVRRGVCWIALANCWLACVVVGCSAYDPSLLTSAIDTPQPGVSGNVPSAIRVAAGIDGGDVDARGVASATAGAGGAYAIVEGESGRAGSAAGGHASSGGTGGVAADSGADDAGVDAGVDAGSDDAALPDAGPICGDHEVELDGHCYALIATESNFDTALTACQSRGAGWGLVEVNSAAENELVATLIGTTEAWIGADDRGAEGSWLWQSGIPFWSGDELGTPVGGEYTSFLAGEPNDEPGTADCMRIVPGGGWRDDGCGSSHAAVCEQIPD
jgi:hypothetical protein